MADGHTTYTPVRVRRSGTNKEYSLIITLHRDVVEAMNLRYGEFLTVKSDGKRIILEKLQ